MSLAAVAQAGLLALCAALQEQKPAAPVQPAPPLAEAPLVPGEIPAATSAEARAAWLALCAATSGATPQAKVTGFELTVEGRATPGGREAHDFDGARYRYLEPGWIATRLADGTERMRGPAGDYFVREGQATRLQGEQFAGDLRELDEQARIAHSFVRLIDGRALRLRSLALVPAPPPVLPASLKKLAGELGWLVVESPDFDSDPRAGAKPVLSRAWIGFDKAKSTPQLALVARDDRGTIVHESAVLVRMEECKAFDGFQVPSKLRSFQPNLEVSPWVFSEKPTLSLWLISGTLRPKLSATDFEPPKKKR